MPPYLISASTIKVLKQIWRLIELDLWPHHNTTRSVVKKECCIAHRGAMNPDKRTNLHTYTYLKWSQVPSSCQLEVRCMGRYEDFHWWRSLEFLQLIQCLPQILWLQHDFTQLWNDMKKKKETEIWENRRLTLGEGNSLQKGMKTNSQWLSFFSHQCSMFLTWCEVLKAEVISDQLSLVYSSVSMVDKRQTVSMPWSSSNISNFPVDARYSILTVVVAVALVGVVCL
jgi:hypothetical protein